MDHVTKVFVRFLLKICKTFFTFLISALPKEEPAVNNSKDLMEVVETASSVLNDSGNSINDIAEFSDEDEDIPLGKSV